jgi:dienelactone hydrolase
MVGKRNRSRTWYLAGALVVLFCSARSGALSIGARSIIVFLSLITAIGSARAEGDKVTIPLISDGKPDQATTSVTGYVFRPAGAGPFPAVILLHGCEGLGWRTARQAGWQFLSGRAERLVGLGYLALVLDSFEPRGVREACGKPLTVSPDRRAWDALSAVRFLVNQGDVDPARVVLEGRSHGGVVVLVALERDRWHVPEHFAGGIAWYPGCRWTRAGFTAPVLILIGEADDWTKAGECRDLARRLASSGEDANLLLRVYPNATHAFDAPGGARYAYGHWMQHDPTATADAWIEVDAFLREHLQH